MNALGSVVTSSWAVEKDGRSTSARVRVVRPVLSKLDRFTKSPILVRQRDA